MMGMMMVIIMINDDDDDDFNNDDDVSIPIIWKKVTGYSQLFERGSGRNLKSHFGAFNTQWTFLSNWNPSLKYVSTFHFLTKLIEFFCGVNVDAKAAGTKF